MQDQTISLIQGHFLEKWPGAVSRDMEYWTITTTDEKGDKALGGGMMKRMHPEHQVTNYIDVKSVDEYSSKVQKIGGGKVVVPKMAVPRMGYLAICLTLRITLLVFGRLMKVPSE